MGERWGVFFALTLCSCNERTDSQGGVIATQPAPAAAPALTTIPDGPLRLEKFLSTADAVIRGGKDLLPSAGLDCYDEPDDPEFGWCDAYLPGAQDSSGGTVKWRKDDTRALEISSPRLDFAPEFNIPCSRFGGAMKEVRHWKWSLGQMSAELRLCESADRFIWIKHAPLGTYVRVFTRSAFESQPDFRETCRTQGTTIP